MSLITLKTALSYSQHQEPDNDACKWNGGIITSIIYTHGFPAVMCQNDYTDVVRKWIRGNKKVRFFVLHFFCDDNNNVYQKSLVVNHHWRTGWDWLRLFLCPFSGSLLLLRRAPLPHFGTIYDKINAWLMEGTLTKGDIKHLSCRTATKNNLTRPAKFEAQFCSFHERLNSTNGQFQGKYIQTAMATRLMENYSIKKKIYLKLLAAIECAVFHIWLISCPFITVFKKRFDGNKRPGSACD